MDFLIASVMLSYIQGNYPGGLDQFKQEGGCIGLLPGTILMFIPKEVTDLKDKLTAVANNMGLKVEFCEARNFDDASPEEREETFITMCDNILAAVPTLKFAPCVTPLSFTVSIVDGITDEDLRKVQDVIENTNGIYQYHLIYEGKIIASQGSITKPAVVNRITPETPKRDIPIDNIDVGALHQALDTVNSVEDFLKSF